MVRFDKEDLSSLSAYGGDDGGEEFELRDAAITKRILRVSFEFLAFLLLACIGSAGYLSTTWEKEVSAPQYTDGKSNLVNAVLESAPLTGLILHTKRIASRKYKKLKASRWAQ